MAISYDDISSELLESAKKAVRVSDAAFEDEVDMLIRSAAADLVRVGIDESCFDEESPYYPLVKQAVVLRCKSLFGQDNPNAEMDFWRSSYEQTVDDLLNSGANGASNDRVE